MERHFDTELDQLKQQLLKMGALAEAMIDSAVTALVERNTGQLDQIYEQEKEVNSLQVSIDEDCLRLTALYQPAAGDLRFLLGASKINTELERLGDQAINICEMVNKLLQEPQLKPLIDIPKMVAIATDMVRDSLNAFVERDVSKAKAVLMQDDQLDDLKDKIVAELTEFMTKDSGSISRAIQLILVTRSLERIGDHATNIAEDVIFVVQGRDIRHNIQDL
ncbi:MAG: phosphate signaling complex protein PhoU [Candidatus Edwardsbacteria bacterium]|nr:phosphate signaling complex protein PhoU [Candidatus Edwardsbacteria bacterium]MBU1576818.1 phosphate signaling complex protein PhoU [Candidatus Edwardsbacteria bacterium]MBU2463909.1 phosphate signaling complex protein PhoU [Candidatus Edwardsbacteria bacterium]MBU2593325.1 phosphate signaling complex protein PhoU [Candidatus Edwardsbacteria bacterium]